MISLLQTPIFKNFTEEELADARKVLRNKTLSYKKNEILLFEGNTTTSLGIILEGSVSIERIDYQGNKNILGLNSAGQIFAETYAMTGKPLMIDVVANEDCVIFYLEIQLLKSTPTNHPWISKFLMNLLLISNNKNLELSGRNFHTFSKHIRGRVLSYLTTVSHEKNAKEFDIPMNRQQMADYLNVDRSALSAELCKMRDDGIIVFRKNHFILK